MEIHVKNFLESQVVFFSSGSQFTLIYPHRTFIQSNWCHIWHHSK